MSATQQLQSTMEDLVRGARLQTEELERLAERIDRSIRRAAATMAAACGRGNERPIESKAVGAG